MNVNDFGNAREVNDYIARLEAEIVRLDKAVLSAASAQRAALLPPLIELAIIFEEANSVTWKELSQATKSIINAQRKTGTLKCMEFCSGGLPECEHKCPMPLSELQAKQAEKDAARADWDEQVKDLLQF